nr:carboxypeptidase regulatory-like domain-containing protein [Nitrospirota bacterium]
MDAAKQASNDLNREWSAVLFRAFSRIALAVSAGWVSGVTYPAGIAEAMHEVDHRFTVEGHVCGVDGRPVPEAKVMVKDTRVSIGTAVFTDAHGYYKAVLHLHNDNRGDPIWVAALEQEQKVTAQFDPADVKNERHVTVNIGSSCAVQQEESSRWVYYGAGIGLAVAAGVGFVKNRQRSHKRGKGQKK